MARYEDGCVNELDGYFKYIKEKSTGDTRLYHQSLRNRDKFEDAMEALDYQMIQDRDLPDLNQVLEDYVGKYIYPIIHNYQFI